MKFTPTALAGVWTIELDRIEDERGWFARNWCSDEFRERGLNPNLSQCSFSFNRRRGTLRGLHYQAAPHQEAKLVRCIRGAIFDVALDLRHESPSFKQWTGVTLTAETGSALYIPEGCAHGFQTLLDDTEILYFISVPWQATSSRGIRWNDPEVAIRWPLPNLAILSDRDKQLPLIATSA